MRQFLPFLLPLLALTMSCAQKDGYAQGTPKGSDTLAALSDEFDNASTMGNWKHAYKVEGWTANQLERFDIGKTKSGWMMMEPYASSWYRDYRGILAYKPVEGDFVMTIRLHVSGRNGSGAPRTQYSLAGIMIRAPRTDSAKTWQPGQENYVFLSLGTADKSGTFQFEVKTTLNSDSQLQISPASSGDAIIQVARIGNDFILLKNSGGEWSVHRRYPRPDFPKRVQAGLTCYTDWPSVEKLSPQQHNNMVIRNGNPDLIALYDFVHYQRPQVPKRLAGKRLSDPNSVSDADLLSFLGDEAL